MRRVPVYSPWMLAEDASAVSRAVSGGSISGAAPIVGAFEREWAALCAMPHSVAVSSGTAALELAIRALGLGPGDEVICPALTIISCARAIVLSGAQPVLVDVDPHTWCLDPEHVEARLSPRTRAILGVHLFGRPYDHARLDAIKARHRLAMIEDAAQAHGARVRNGPALLPCGSLGDVSVFSFYANKAVTTGEGGMVLSRSERVIERVRDLSNLFLRGPRRFLHEDLGHNYRMSSLQAALGLSQLNHLRDTLSRKRTIGRLYRERLAQREDMELQIEGDDEYVPWMNAIVLSDAVGADANELSALLSARGVETRPFFVGLHDQPALLRRGLFVGERYPVTERLARQGLYLPSGLDLNEETVEHVVRELSSALGELRSQRARPSPADARSVPPADGRVFGPDYAEAYDAFYEDKDYATEVSFLLQCFERFSRIGVRRVLDLGCGSGRHAEELARRGLDVVGVDRSAAMLLLARKRVPDARFVEGDMQTVELDDQFDAVAILFAALGYQTTIEGILAALRTARRHSKPGGLLVGDVWLGALGNGRDTPTRRVARRGAVEWTRTGWITRDPIAQRVDLAYELRRTESGRESVTHEVHSMHYFSPFELELALSAAGFGLVRLCREGDLEQTPGAEDLTAFFVAEAR